MPCSAIVGGRLREDAAVHVEADDVDGCPAAEFGGKAVVGAGDSPGAAAEINAERTVSWSRGFDRVDPVGDAPDAALEVGGLAGKEPEEDLRCAAFDPHERPPRS